MSPSSLRRIAAIWLPRLATDLAAPPASRLRDLPLVVTVRDRRRLVVVGTNRPADLAGAAPGQGLADARALCPGLQAVETDPVSLRHALDRLARWCGRYTPWVGMDGAAGSFEGGLLLDLTGCTHLYGGEARLLDDLARGLRGFGFEARVALADTTGAAWAWSRFRPAGSDPVLASHRQRSALAPLPVTALRLPADTAEALKRLGLRRVGDLLDLPAASLAARFGPLVRRRLDQALGAMPEPLDPLAPPPVHHMRHRFGDAVLAPEAIVRALEGLLAALARRLERDGTGARRLALALHRIDGTTATAEIGTSRPGRDPAHLLRLFAPKLEGLDPDPGVEVVTLAVRSVEPCGPSQTRMPGTARKGEERPDVAALVDRLAGRFGADRVLCAHPVETPLPEGQVLWRSRLHHPPGDWSDWTWRRTAPVRLFPSPVPVEFPSPAGRHRPPVCVRWRRRGHLLRPIRGPDRRRGAWWTAAGNMSGEAREYWTAEDATGRRLWLLLDRTTGRWAVHGLTG